MWPPSSAQPAWKRVQLGNWIELVRCLKCNRLWCVVPFEPYASFPYAVRWHRSEQEWNQLNELDDARVLHRWHKARMQALRSEADEQDERAIEWHRKRSYGQTPFDEPEEELPDLDSLFGAA